MPLKLSLNPQTRQLIKNYIVSKGPGEIDVTFKNIKEAELVVPIISPFNSPK